MTRAREAARLIGNNTFRLDSNNAVGFNSTTPDAMFDINHGLTVAGVSTFTGNVTMEGDLTVQGTTTTIDTDLIGVDKVEVGANNSTVGLAVTQSGSGKIIAGYDGTTEVFSVADGGSVGINDSTPDATLSVGGATAFVDIGVAGGNRAKLGYTSNDLYFGTSSSSGEFIFKNNVTSSGNPEASGTERLRITSAGNVSIQNDSGKFTCGASDDLEIYHDGSNSYIKDVGTGILQINTNYFQVKNAADDEFIIQASQNGAVSLRFDNSEKFETTGGGVNVTGICTATSFVGSGANLTGLPAGFTELDAALFN